MIYKLSFLKEAAEDYRRLDASQRLYVDKTLKKIRRNPLVDKEGGYGKPLSNQNSSKLAGYLKIKLKKQGIRIIYKLEKTENEVIVIIIGMREDSKVYKEAAKRVAKLK